MSYLTEEWADSRPRPDIGSHCDPTAHEWGVAINIVCAIVANLDDRRGFTFGAIDGERVRRGLVSTLDAMGAVLDVMASELQRHE